MSKLAMGIDIGITSVGYGVIDLDDGKFIDYGVRLFKEGTAEDNEKRRNARGRRRLTSRRHTRLRDMNKALEQFQIKGSDYHPLSNVYELRCKGLKEKLTCDELTAVILHITKHRGSTLDVVEENEAKNADILSTKEILRKNDEEIKQGKFICEIQMERLLMNHSVRGHANNFTTKDYVSELQEILKHQDLSAEAIDAIITIVQRRRAYYEGPGSEKSPTPYGRFIEENGGVVQIDLIEKMRGKCSVFPDLARAPKMSISAELFNFLNDLNNLVVNGEKLSVEAKHQIFSIVNKKGKITLKQLAKCLQVEESDIKGYRIDKKDKAQFTEFKGYKKLKQLCQEDGLAVSLQDYEMLDEIIEILTKKKGIEERKEALKGSVFGMSDYLVDILAEATGITGYHALSLKALRMLNKEMFYSEFNQMQLLHQLNLLNQNRISYKGQRNITANADAILSPVVKRAQNEAFKVINQLRKKYGEFDTIVIEMARDKNSNEQKKRINDMQKRREKSREEMDKMLKDLGYDLDKINSKIRMKLSLYEQQEGKSAYTFQPIDLKRLITDPKYTEIDHIIPISISLDDSQNNKVLALQSENQMKSYLTPFMAFQANKFADMTYPEYKARVLSNPKYSYKKKMNLLNESDITKMDVKKDFINRNLVDTRYACRVVLNTLKDYFKDNEIHTKVHTINGQLTHLFRRKSHLDKDREENFLHHAIDALIVVSIKKLQLVNNYLFLSDMENQGNGGNETTSSIPSDEQFYEEHYLRYISDLRTLYQQSSQYYNRLISLSDMMYAPIKISHKIDTKANRQFADETIYSTRNRDGIDYVVEKIPDIYDPKSKKCKALVESILNHDDQKYLMARNDPQTFAILKEIVQNHYVMYKQDETWYGVKNGKIELKGENPLAGYKKEHGFIKKYAKRGNGPAIVSMKYESEKLGVHLLISRNYDLKDNKKVVLRQISPYRTDFYHCDDGKFRFVTVRYANVKYDKKEKKYVISKQWYEDEMQKKNIKSTDEFLFSLHRDELIGIIRKQGDSYYYDASTEGKGDKQYSDGIHPEILKFTGTNNDAKGVIEVKPIYAYCKKQLMPSIQSVVGLKKFSTDALGNLYEVKKNTLKLEFD